MLKKAAALFLVLGSIAMWMSCGSTSNRYVYAAMPTSNQIVAYREDPNSGALIQLTGSPIVAGPGVEALAMHPSGKYLYAANSGQNNLSQYTITAGALNEQTPRPTAGTSPTVLAIDPAGTFLYVGNSGSFDISVFKIGSTDGKLSAVPQLSGATAPIGLVPLNMALSPSGNVLYVTGEGTVGYIEAFPLTNGVLGAPLTGSPYTTGNIPYGLAIAPGSGNGFLYTANKLDNSISEFTIQSDGSLQHLTDVGETYTSPVSLLVDKSAKYLYVANQGNGNLIGFSIGADGSLTLLGASPFITGTEPSVLAGDPGGGFLFVGYGAASSPSLQSFSLATSSGTLTSVSTYSLTGSGAPTSMVVTP